MIIAVVGTGKVGSALARNWQRAGHTIVLGARNPDDERPAALARELGAEARSPRDAAERADVVLLAVPGGAAIDTARALSPVLAGRVVIVAANEMARATPNLAAAVAEAAPGAEIVRAFNTVTAETMASGAIGGMQADMLYAASSPEADAIAGELIAACGLRPISIGGIDRAGLLDDLFALWAALAFQQGHGRGIAFKLVGGPAE